MSIIFDLQYSLLIGPFLDALLLFGLTIIGLIFSFVTIPLNGFKKLFSYLPLIIIISAFVITISLPQLRIGNYIHYYSNKNNLDFIDKECSNAGVYDFTDMLRYQKRLNKKYISNDAKYKTTKQIENAFGDYIREENLDLNKIVEIQQRMINSNIISLNKTDGCLILTIDGFVDNEYGYVKSYNKDLKVGDTLPPFGFTIVRLIKFKNGWYFFYTT